MLNQFLWRSSLVLLIILTTTYAHYPAALKLRDLVTGTPASLGPYSTKPPYPTGRSNTTAIATGTAYPTAPTATSNSTAPSPIPSVFQLLATGTGTFLDGDFLFLAIDNEGDINGNLDELVFDADPDDPPDDIPFTLFHLNANGTLDSSVSGLGGLGRAFEPAYQSWLFNVPYRAQSPTVESVCEIVEGELRCVTGVNTVFHVCLNIAPDGTGAQGRGVVRVGPKVQEGCYPLTLLVVPF